MRASDAQRARLRCKILYCLTDQPNQNAPTAVVNHVAATNPRNTLSRQAVGSPSSSALGSRLHHRRTTTCPRSARRWAPHRHVHLEYSQHTCRAARNLTSSSPPRSPPTSWSRRRENPRAELKPIGKTRSFRQRGCRRVAIPASSRDSRIGRLGRWSRIAIVDGDVCRSLKKTRWRCAHTALGSADMEHLPCSRRGHQQQPLAPHSWAQRW